MGKFSLKSVAVTPFSLLLWLQVSTLLCHGQQEQDFIITATATPEQQNEEVFTVSSRESESFTVTKEENNISHRVTTEFDTQTTFRLTDATSFTMTRAACPQRNEGHQSAYANNTPNTNNNNTRQSIDSGHADVSSTAPSKSVNPLFLTDLMNFSSFGVFSATTAVDSGISYHLSFVGPSPSCPFPIPSSSNRQDAAYSEPPGILDQCRDDVARYVQQQIEKRKSENITVADRADAEGIFFILSLPADSLDLGTCLIFDKFAGYGPAIADNTEGASSDNGAQTPRKTVLSNPWVNHTDRIVRRVITSRKLKAAADGESNKMPSGNKNNMTNSNNHELFYDDTPTIDTDEHQQFQHSVHYRYMSSMRPGMVVELIFECRTTEAFVTRLHMMGHSDDDSYKDDGSIPQFVQRTSTGRLLSVQRAAQTREHDVITNTSQVTVVRVRILTPTACPPLNSTEVCRVPVVPPTAPFSSGAGQNSPSDRLVGQDSLGRAPDFIDLAALFGSYVQGHQPVLQYKRSPSTGELNKVDDATFFFTASFCGAPSSRALESQDYLYYTNLVRNGSKCEVPTSTITKGPYDNSPDGQPDAYTDPHGFFVTVGLTSQFLSSCQYKFGRAVNGPVPGGLSDRLLLAYDTHTPPSAAPLYFPHVKQLVHAVNRRHHDNDNNDTAINRTLSMQQQLLRQSLPYYDQDKQAVVLQYAQFDPRSFIAALQTVSIDQSKDGVSKQNVQLPTLVRIGVVNIHCTGQNHAVNGSSLEASRENNAASYIDDVLVGDDPNAFFYRVIFNTYLTKVPAGGSGTIEANTSNINGDATIRSNTIEIESIVIDDENDASMVEINLKSPLVCRQQEAVKVPPTDVSAACTHVAIPIKIAENRNETSSSTSSLSSESNHSEASSSFQSGQVSYADGNDDNETRQNFYYNLNFADIESVYGTDIKLLDETFRMKSRMQLCGAPDDGDSANAKEESMIRSLCYKSDSSKSNDNGNGDNALLPYVALYLERYKICFAFTAVAQLPTLRYYVTDSLVKTEDSSYSNVGSTDDDKVSTPARHMKPRQYYIQFIYSGAAEVDGGGDAEEIRYLEVNLFCHVPTVEELGYTCPDENGEPPATTVDGESSPTEEEMTITPTILPTDNTEGSSTGSSSSGNEGNTEESGVSSSTMESDGNSSNTGDDGIVNDGDLTSTSEPGTLQPSSDSDSEGPFPTDYHNSSESNSDSSGTGTSNNSSDTEANGGSSSSSSGETSHGGGDGSGNEETAVPIVEPSFDADAMVLQPSVQASFFPELLRVFTEHFIGWRRWLSAGSLSDKNGNDARSDTRRMITESLSSRVRKQTRRRRQEEEEGNAAATVQNITVSVRRIVSSSAHFVSKAATFPIGLSASTSAQNDTQTILERIAQYFDGATATMLAAQYKTKFLMVNMTSPDVCVGVLDDVLSYNDWKRANCERPPATTSNDPEGASSAPETGAPAPATQTPLKPGTGRRQEAEAETQTVSPSQRQQKSAEDGERAYINQINEYVTSQFRQYVNDTVTYNGGQYADVKLRSACRLEVSFATIPSNASTSAEQNNQQQQQSFFYVDFSSASMPAPSVPTHEQPFYLDLCDTSAYTGWNESLAVENDKSGKTQSCPLVDDGTYRVDSALLGAQNDAIGDGNNITLGPLIAIASVPLGVDQNTSACNRDTLYVNSMIRAPLVVFGERATRRQSQSAAEGDTLDKRQRQKEDESTSDSAADRLVLHYGFVNFAHLQQSLMGGGANSDSSITTIGDNQMKDTASSNSTTVVVVSIYCDDYGVSEDDTPNANPLIFESMSRELNGTAGTQHIFITMRQYRYPAASQPTADRQAAKVTAVYSRSVCLLFDEMRRRAVSLSPSTAVTSGVFDGAITLKRVVSRTTEEEKNETDETDTNAPAASAPTPEPTDEEEASVTETQVPFYETIPFFIAVGAAGLVSCVVIFCVCCRSSRKLIDGEAEQGRPRRDSNANGTSNGESNRREQDYRMNNAGNPDGDRARELSMPTRGNGGIRASSEGGVAAIRERQASQNQFQLQQQQYGRVGGSRVGSIVTDAVHRGGVGLVSGDSIGGRQQSGRGVDWGGHPPPLATAGPPVAVRVAASQSHNRPEDLQPAPQPQPTHYFEQCPICQNDIPIEVGEEADVVISAHIDAGCPTPVLRALHPVSSSASSLMTEQPQHLFQHQSLEATAPQVQVTQPQPTPPPPRTPPVTLQHQQHVGGNTVHPYDTTRRNQNDSHHNDSLVNHVMNQGGIDLFNQMPKAPEEEEGGNVMAHLPQGHTVGGNHPNLPANSNFGEAASLGLSEIASPNTITPAQSNPSRRMLARQMEVSAVTNPSTAVSAHNAPVRQQSFAQPTVGQVDLFGAPPTTEPPTTSRGIHEEDTTSYLPHQNLPQQAHQQQHPPISLHRSFDGESRSSGDADSLAAEQTSPGDHEPPTTRSQRNSTQQHTHTEQRSPSTLNAHPHASSDPQIDNKERDGDNGKKEMGTMNTSDFFSTLYSNVDNNNQSSSTTTTTNNNNNIIGNQVRPNTDIFSNHVDVDQPSRRTAAHHGHNDENLSNADEMKTRTDDYGLDEVELDQDDRHRDVFCSQTASVGQCISDERQGSAVAAVDAVVVEAMTSEDLLATIDNTPCDIHAAEAVNAFRKFLHDVLTSTFGSSHDLHARAVRSILTKFVRENYVDGPMLLDSMLFDDLSRGLDAFKRGAAVPEDCPLFDSLRQYAHDQCSNQDSSSTHYVTAVVAIMEYWASRITLT